MPETKKAEPAKPAKQAKVETPKQKKQAVVEKPAEKKPEPQKSPAKKEKKVNVETKAKKAAQNVSEKPADFDEGEWESAPTRKEKKNKKKEDPEYIPQSPERGSKKKTAAVAATKKDGEKPAPVEEKQAASMPTVRLEDILPKEQIELIKAGVVPTAVEAPALVAEVESAGGDQAAKKKKKKAKSVSEDAPEPVKEVPAPSPKKEAPAPSPKKEAPAPSPKKVAPAPLLVEEAAGGSESLQAFNELEETWQEAPQKKSKKKARKDWG